MVFGWTGWVSKMLSVFSYGGARTSRFKFQLLLPILYTNICVCICLSHICMYLWHLQAEYLQLSPGTMENNDEKPYCFSINYCGIYTKALSKNCSKLIFLWQCRIIQTIISIVWPSGYFQREFAAFPRQPGTALPLVFIEHVYFLFFDNDPVCTNKSSCWW